MDAAPSAAIIGKSASRRSASESQPNGKASFNLIQKTFGAVILGSLAFVPLYSLGVILKGYPRMPLVYVGLVGFIAAEYAGRHNIFGLPAPNEGEADK